MGVEIERKFVVLGESWRASARAAYAIRQRVVARDPSGVLVRIRVKGKEAFLTVKGPRFAGGLGCPEFECHIPVTTAEAVLNELPGPNIDKERFEVEWQGRLWEIDVFHGDNAGLVVAEIEFKSLADAQSFTELPPWAGREVTQEARYYNAALETNPWSTWGSTEPA